MDREQNGAKLLATVLVPADAYPNTTFEHGSLQLIIKDSSTQAGCRQAFAPEQADSRGVKEMEVQGVRFDGRETRSTTGGAIIVETVFTWNGLGYYYFTQLTASDYPSIQAVLMIGALAVLLANLLAEPVVAFVRALSASRSRPIRFRHGARRDAATGWM